MTYIIERDRPIPARTTGIRGEGKWGKLANAMSVGDSVEVNSLIEAKSLYSAFKKTGKKSCQRLLSGKLYVWRIE